MLEKQKSSPLSIPPNSNPNKLAENLIQFAQGNPEKIKQIGEQILNQIAQILGQMKL